MRGDGHGSARGATRAAAGDTVSLLRRYVVQETVGPLKHVGRTLAYGIAGALLLGVGAVVLLLAVLRVLEGETGTTFAGSWSFAPYLLVGVVALGAAGLATVVGLKGAKRGARSAGGER
jgi:hypothetical protein